MTVLLQVLTFCKKRMYELVADVTSLVQRYLEVRATIPKLFAPLMRAQLLQLERTLDPGLTSVIWTSLYCNEFIKAVNEKLDEIVGFVKEVSDMKTARVDATLDALSDTPLLWLPPEAVPPKEFLAKNMEHLPKMAAEVAIKSTTAEGAVKELIDRFADTYSDQFGEERYQWLDREKAAKAVSSQTKLDDLSQEDGEQGDGDTPRQRHHARLGVLTAVGFPGS